MRIQHHEHSPPERKRGVEIKLLVSLIAPEESKVLEGRLPDIIDIKNPSNGSLGMPDNETIKRIRERTPKDIPISVAIGDANNNQPLYRKRAKEAVSAGADIVKVGLYDFNSDTEKIEFLTSLRGSVEKNIKIVAACYADRIEDDFLKKFPSIAQEAGMDGCLIDTYSKDSGKLTSHIAIGDLKRFVDECEKKKLFSALAGGLNEDDIDWLNKVRPSIVGFRGAVARNGRGEAGLDGERLENLIKIFTSVPLEPITAEP